MSKGERVGRPELAMERRGSLPALPAHPVPDLDCSECGGFGYVPAGDCLWVDCACLTIVDAELPQ